MNDNLSPEEIANAIERLQNQPNRNGKVTVDAADVALLLRAHENEKSERRRLWDELNTHDLRIEATKSAMRPLLALLGVK